MTGAAEDESRNCPFCAIAAGGDRTVEVVCEAADWLAFFPLEPATTGHTLVIPREHHPDLWDVGDALGSELMGAVVRVGRAIRTALSPDGMNLITSSGHEAEQTVFHLHLHLVPRWGDDRFGRIWPPHSRVDESQDLHEVAERIRRACAER